jgi:Ca2+-binding RTX toxin-like protein
VTALTIISDVSETSSENALVALGGAGGAQGAAGAGGTFGLGAGAGGTNGLAGATGAAGTDGTGGANSYGLSLAATATVTISGAGDLDLGEVYATKAGVVTIDASGLTGDLTVTTTLGADTVTGGDGDDTINGALGADTIDGGAGDDIITGGDGADALTGGEGADTFVFGATAVANGADTIADFETGSDVLDMTAFGAGGAGAAVDVGIVLTAAAGTVFYLGGQAAGAADSANGVSTAMNAATIVTDSTNTSWIVISDDNSTAVYEWVDDLAGAADEVATGELTLVATITGTVVLDDILASVPV